MAYQPQVLLESLHFNLDLTTETKIDFIAENWI